MMTKQQTWMEQLVKEVILPNRNEDVLQFLDSNFETVSNNTWEYTTPTFTPEGKYIVICIKLESQQLSLEVTKRYKEDNTASKTLGFTEDITNLTLEVLKDKITAYMKELVLGKTYDN